MATTRAISGGARPFPQSGDLKTIGQVSDYINTLGNWINYAIDGLNKQAKNIPYAPSANLPPFAGPTRLIQIPDDPVYGQILAYNGVGTSGTQTGWYRIIPAGTVSGSSVNVPAGGTTSQILGKVSGADYNMAWQTPEYIPAGGTTGQALLKTSNSDYAAAWATINQLTKSNRKRFKRKSPKRRASRPARPAAPRDRSLPRTVTVIMTRHGQRRTI